MEQYIEGTLNQLKRLIYNDNMKSVLNSIRNKDVIIFLGNTRNGKSTIVNYIIGTPLKATKVRHKVYNIYKQDQSSSGPVIGAGPVSETSVPSIWNSSKFTSLIVDSPGFQDNRGEAQDIANAFYIKEILANVNSAKFVIISDINELMNDNINSFISLMDSIHKMLPLGDSLNPSVTMVFNKDQDNLTNNDIATLLKDKIIDQTDIEIAKRSLINHLATHLNQISIVKMPTAEGNVNEAYVFGNLIATIESSTTKLGKASIASVSPGISDKSKNFLLEARKYFSEMKDFDQLMAVVLDNFYKSMSVYDNVQRFTNSEQVPPVKNELITIENNVKTIQNPSLSTKELLQKMSAVLPSVQELKDGSQIYTKLNFIAFVDKLLNLTESNTFKVKINDTVTQMLNRINVHRNNLNDRQQVLTEEENRARLQKLKEEQERQAELQRLELERLRKIQEQLIRDPPRPHPVERVIGHIVNPVNQVIVRPVENLVKKCSIM